MFLSCLLLPLQLYHNYVNGNSTDGTSSGTDGCPTPNANDLSADPATCVLPVTQVPNCWHIVFF